MRIQAEASILRFLAILPALSFAVTFDCEHVIANGKPFDLSSLKGPHSLSHVVKESSFTQNTTFILDICQPLDKEKWNCKVGTWGSIPVSDIVVP